MNETLEVENTKKISKSIVQEKTIINDNYCYCCKNFLFVC